MSVQVSSSVEVQTIERPPPIVRSAADARWGLENLQFAPHLVYGFGQLLAKGLF